MSPKELYQSLEDAGHVLKRDPAGKIDNFVLDFDNHNGPGCSFCGQTWCEYCENTVIPCPERERSMNQKIPFGIYRCPCCAEEFAFCAMVDSVTCPCCKFDLTPAAILDHAGAIAASKARIRQNAETVHKLLDEIGRLHTDEPLDFATAAQKVRDEMKKDDDLYNSYYSTISMAIFDNSKLRPEACNDLAKVIMNKLFECEK